MVKSVRRKRRGQVGMPVSSAGGDSGFVSRESGVEDMRDSMQVMMIGSFERELRALSINYDDAPSPPDGFFTTMP